MKMTYSGEKKGISDENSILRQFSMRTFVVGGHYCDDNELGHVAGNPIMAKHCSQRVPENTKCQEDRESASLWVRSGHEFGQARSHASLIQTWSNLGYGVPFELKQVGPNKGTPPFFLLMWVEIGWAEMIMA